MDDSRAPGGSGVIRCVATTRDIKTEKTGLGSEVEYQADFEVGGTQIVEELAAGDGVKGRCRLDLDHDRVIDHEVESVEAEFLALEAHAHGVLTHHVPAARNFRSRASA